jgi:collagenase-like PrtC family protease
MTLDLTSSLPEILDAGASAIRVDVLLDNKAAAASAVTRVRDALDRAVVGVRSKKSEKSAAKTSGHFYRGVL